jgi:flagellar hook-basal body complex protein FliE
MIDSSGLGNTIISNASIMKNYMNVYNENLKNIKTPDSFSTPENEELLRGGISKTQISDDPELASDLNTLNGPESMSSDKTVKSFSNVIGEYINDVNNKQTQAEKAVETFATGGNIDIHSVMIATEKANLSMQLALQMRNKILQAYQEISRMQI